VHHENGSHRHGDENHVLDKGRNGRRHDADLCTMMSGSMMSCCMMMNGMPMMTINMTKACASAK